MENEDNIESTEIDAVVASVDTGILGASFEKMMNSSYLNYAMSVIVSRAVPDVRDGMKPVHRRIVFAMHEGKYTAGKAYNKSAKIVGDVMGNYHPHGDAAIYETMVRLAQPWTQRHPLIDGQGNFGSRDGDPAAAMRYTESRMARLTHSAVEDLEYDTVDYQPNYDGRNKEPKVLPVRFPNLLVNGQQGIAVAMATNIPTHNLGETLDACLMVLENPKATLAEVMTVLPGPDFPTGGTIQGTGGIREAYTTGRGSIRVAGKAEVVELKGGKSQIVVTELPYGYSAKAFLEKVVDLVKTKTIEGITDARDESDRVTPLRAVLDIHRDADPHIILNALKKKTQLVTSFGYNATVLNSRGKPVEMPLLDILNEFVSFRRIVVRRRTEFKLNKARDALHELLGLYAAVSMIDEIVEVIKSSPDTETAHARLRAIEFSTAGDFAQLLKEADPDEEVGDVFKLSEIQANTILGMRLRSLTGMARDQVAEKVRETSQEIHGFILILNDVATMNDVIRNEFEEIRAKFSSERLTTISPFDAEDIDDEDLIERRDIVITISKSGYVKTTELSAYREQKRGGKGRTGMETKDDDFVQSTIICTTKTPLVFFTSRGIAHSLKAYKLPEGAPNSKGRPLVNFVPLRESETISAVIAMPEVETDLDDKSLVFVTDFGSVRRNDAKAFSGINKGGKIAIKLEDEHGNPEGKLVEVLLCSNEDDVIVVTRAKECVRFPVEDVREVKSRSGTGVKAITLANGNEVVAASILKHVKASTEERNAYLAGGRLTVDNNETGESYTVDLSAERMAELRDNEEFILTISALGFGKRSSAYDYRTTARGAKGIAAANVTPATGPLVACFPVVDEDGIVMITDGGQVIRTRVKDVRKTGRATRGVKMFNLPDGQQIVSVAKVGFDDIDETDLITPINEPDAEAETQENAE